MKEALDFELAVLLTGEWRPRNCVQLKKLPPHPHTDTQCYGVFNKWGRFHTSTVSSLEFKHSQATTAVGMCNN